RTVTGVQTCALPIYLFEADSTASRLSHKVLTHCRTSNGNISPNQTPNTTPGARKTMGWEGETPRAHRIAGTKPKAAISNKSAFQIGRASCRERVKMR